MGAFSRKSIHKSPLPGGSPAASPAPASAKAEPMVRLVNMACFLRRAIDCQIVDLCFRWQPSKLSHHLDVPPVSDAFHKFTGAPLVHKDKRAGSSRFRSAKGEALDKLPLLKGEAVTSVVHCLRT